MDIETVAHEDQSTWSREGSDRLGRDGLTLLEEIIFFCPILLTSKHPNFCLTLHCL